MGSSRSPHATASFCAQEMVQLFLLPNFCSGDMKSTSGTATVPGFEHKYGAGGCQLFGEWGYLIIALSSLVVFEGD